MELLTSMVVLVLVAVMTTQMVSKAMSISSASSRQLDTASMARTVLDRIGADLASAALTGGSTMLFYSNASDPKGNTAIGVLCKARSRKLKNASDAIQDARGTFIAYKIRPTTTVSTTNSSIQLPLINRGDAELTFAASGTSDGDKYDSSIWNLFGTGGTKSMPADLVADSGDTTLFDWQGFGDGVVRFHVSFVLDDGSIMQSVKSSDGSVDATYQNFQANGDPASKGCLPVAFSAATSNDKNKRYVKGLIVGIAVLDEGTVNNSYRQSNNFIDTLSTVIGRPLNVGETPVGVWQANLNNSTTVSNPIRQNIRFYQRFYSVNL